jgi:hypothetical protein
MLTKCANGKCTARLRYLHDGRLFVIRRTSVVTSKPHIEYKWLCARCCRSMTLTAQGYIHMFQQRVSSRGLVAETAFCRSDTGVIPVAACAR